MEENIDLRTYLFNYYSGTLKEISDLEYGLKKDFNDIKNFPFIKGRQCLYVMNWGISKITFAKGVEEMTGYSVDDFEKKVTGEFIHPDDKPIVARIIRGGMDHIIENMIDTDSVHHLMTYRIKKRTGEYIKVLRKTCVYERDSKNIILSNVSMLTDISFMNNSNRVEWDLNIKDLNVEELRERIKKRFLDFFSDREMEIIMLIRDGLSSKEIANKIHISNHTVSTHRKNILRKSGCHNASQLMSFCRQNGIF